MQHLLRWAAMIGVLVAVVMGSAQGIGRAGPPTTNADVLHLGDCHLPCWIGIVPGQTRLDDARALILHRFPHDLPNLNLLSAVAWSVHITSGGFTIYLIVPPGTSAHITDADPVITGLVLEPNSSLNVGDAVRLLGEPTAIRASATPDQKSLYMVLYYPGVAINVVIDAARGCGSLSPWSGIRSLLISADAPPPNLIQPWQGFRSCYQPQIGSLGGR